MRTGKFWTLGLVDFLGTCDEAATGNDPDSAAYIQELFQDPRFLSFFAGEIEKLKDAVAAIVPNQGQAAAPAANTGVSDPTSEAEPDPAAESQLPSVARSGGGANPEDDFTPEDLKKMNGADARLPYTAADLHRDMRIQNEAVTRLAPVIGLDAAMARVYATPLVPPFDSPRWTSEARKALQDSALMNGWAAMHISPYPDAESFMKRFGEKVEPIATAHPRSFDR
jgi:hypothetical protein